MMYDIYDKCADIVEFRFGRGQHGIGYYDNPGWSEIRLRPVAPSQFIENYNRVLCTIHDIVTQYHLAYERDCNAKGWPASLTIAGNHLNFSSNVIRNGKPESLFALAESDPKALEWSRRALAGVLRCLYEARGINDDWSNKDPLSGDIRYTLGLSRGEFRLAGAFGAHMALYACSILGGGRYGAHRTIEELKQHDTCVPSALKGMKLHDVTENEYTAFSDAFYIKRILQGAEILPDGTLAFNDQYLTERRQHISHALLGYPVPQEFDFLNSGISNNALKTILGRLYFDGEGLNFKRLLNWPDRPDWLNASTESDISKTRYEWMCEALQNIRYDGCFTTLKSEGYRVPVQEPHPFEACLVFSKSIVNEDAYGKQTSLCHVVCSYLNKVMSNPKFYAKYCEVKPERREASAHALLKQINDFIEKNPSTWRASLQKTIAAGLINACRQAQSSADHKEAEKLKYDLSKSEQESYDEQLSELNAIAEFTAFLTGHLAETGRFEEPGRNSVL